MSLPFLDQIMQSWFGYTGDYTLVALGILVFFVVAMVLIGLDFRFALLFCLPLAIAFTANGWFSVWFSVVFWFVSVGITGYLFWTSVSDR